jgi:hypothetical protein
VKSISLPKNDHDTGVNITYIKSRDVLCFSCRYDSGYGGMNPIEISVVEFCNRLGIDRGKKMKTHNTTIGKLENGKNDPCQTCKHIDSPKCVKCNYEHYKAKV